MAKYFVSYDLKRTNPPPHSEFLDQAEKLGWSRWAWGPTSNKWCRLPNTFLIGTFDTKEKAKQAFDAAVSATSNELDVKVTVEKFFIAAYSNEVFNSDDKRDP